MKQYPSVSPSYGTNFFEFKAHVFDKLDGQNIRVEWDKKKGFTKFGSRHRLFDKSDLDFGPVIPLFMETISCKLEYLFKKNKVHKGIVFMEYWGDKSFAGRHQPDDPKRLTVFDACFDNRGFLSPQDFRKMFEGEVDTPKYLGHYNWTRGFVDAVFKGEIVDITFEGVVGKAKERGGELIMAKAKTQKWLDAIKTRFDAKTAETLINS